MPSKAHHSLLSSLASEARHAADAAWATLTSWHVGPRLRKQHFTQEELRDRLIAFGAGTGVCLTILGLFALLAIARRKYGSVKRAYAATMAAIAERRERFNRWRSGSYIKVATAASEDAEEETWPPELFRGKQASEAARAKDRAKMLAKLAKIREQHGGELPEEYQQLQEEADEKDKAAGPTQVKKVKQSSQVVETMSAEEKAELFKLQVEQFKETHRGGASSILACKMPISALLYVVYASTCVAIPLLASRSASCDQGFPWEAHVPFLGVFLVVKFWELFLFTFDDSIPGQLGVTEFLIKFGSSFLGFMDGYSDAVAIVIAHSCGSDLWYWMAFFYLFGVVLMQWLLMGILSMCFDSSGTCFFKMMHMDALALCCTMAPTDKHALLVWKLVNIFRTLFEDLPQCVLQIMFIHYVKQNYVMIVSVLIGVATSCLAVLAALKRAAEAAGTNWERLQAIGNMNKAIAEGDMGKFAKLASEASADNLIDSDELHAQWAKAEEAFNLPCGRKYVCVAPGEAHDVEPKDPEVKARLLRSNQEGSHYSDACRTVEFAIMAAEARQQWMKEAETPDSAAYKRGTHHEARHTYRDLEARRRTVEWAVRAQEEREKRFEAMLNTGPKRSDN